MTRINLAQLAAVACVLAAIASSNACSSEGAAGTEAGYGGRGGTGFGGSSGMGGLAGSGGVGGSGAVPDDTCPGSPVSVSIASSPVVTHGAIAGLHDDYAPYCASTKGLPDGVYDVAAADAGTLTLTLTPTSPGFAPVLYVRSTCDSPVKSLGCASTEPASGSAVPGAGSAGAANGGAPGSDAAVEAGADASVDANPDVSSTGAGGALGDAAAGDGGAPHSATIKLNVTAGEHVYAIVDGTPGSYDFTASVAPPICGDGVVNPGEDCDYGDTLPGDGCSPTCKFEKPKGPDTCGYVASFPYPVTSGFTVGYHDDYDAPCGALTGGPDTVYGFYTSVPGTVTADVSGDFDIVLGLYDGCTSGKLSGLIGCSDSDVATAPEEIKSHVNPGAYFLLIDGYDAQATGKFQLDLQFQPD